MRPIARNQYMLRGKCVKVRPLARSNSNNNNTNDDINPDVFSHECNNSNMGDKSRNGIEDRDLIDMIKANMNQGKNISLYS